MRKLGLAVSGALLAAMSANSFAAQAAPVTQAQFQALQKEVAMLQKQLAAQKVAMHSVKTQHHGKGHAMQAHKAKAAPGSLHIQRLFTEDGYNGTEFWDATDSSNFPLTILQDKNVYPRRSLALGGYLELEPVNSWWGDKFEPYTSGPDKSGTLVPGTGSYKSGNGVGVSAATIDIMANANKWTQIFMEADIHDGTAFLNGFLTLGNLKYTPWYLTIGKFRPRMGVFPGAPWMASIPQGIFRPGHTYNAMLGYSKNNLDAYLAYIPQVDGQKQAVMASAFYNGKFGQSALGYAVDAGYISNISLGESLTGTTLQLQPVSGMVNVDGSLDYKGASIGAGWVSTLKKEALTNNKRATSWYVQAGYGNARIFSKKVGFGVNYAAATNTQNVPMPLAGDANHGPMLYGVKDTAFAYAYSRMTRNILLGLEYGRLWMYNHKKSNEVTLYTAFYF